MLSRVFLLTFAFLGGACATTASAMSSVLHAGYSVRSWQTEDGLPQNSVNAITQTSDGYIWVGTLAGLARFDGDRFVVFDSVSTPRLNDTRVTALYAHANGDLWIGHETGLVTRYSAGQFETIPVTTPRGARIASFFPDRQGALWAVTADGDLHALPPHPTATLRMDEPGTWNLRQAPQADGTLLFSAGTGLHHFDQGAVRKLKLGQARESDYVRGIGTARQGGWWVIWDNRVRRWREDGWQEEHGRWEVGEISVLHELRDGSVAFGTMDHGLRVIRPDGLQVDFNHETARMPHWVRVVFEDREGILWIGAGTGGLLAVRRTDISVLNPPDNWQACAVLSVAAGRDGSLWIGTEGAGVYRYHNLQWQHFAANEGFENLFVWSIAEDAAGAQWAGTWTGGIYRRVGGRFERLQPLASINAPVFSMLFPTGAQTPWLGTGNGLLRQLPEKNEWALRHGSLAGVHVIDMARDERGTLWLALGEGGVGRLDEQQLKRFTREDGLSGNGAQCLYLDGDTVWIGTREGGLNRLKNGNFSSVSIEQGLPSKVVCHIIDDGKGYLWLSTHRGIARVSKENLHRCADGLIPNVEAQIYDRNDGLPTMEFSGGLQAAGCRSEDGRLWFPSARGLVSVDPSKIHPNDYVPPIAIEVMRVDGQLARPGRTGAAEALRLAPDHQRLEFEYTALSYSAPQKNRFKYRLVGLDNDWIENGSNRSAAYSHLPAGAYVFQVIGCNNDGVWNTTGASLAFTVLPFYWQTWWFRGGAAVFVLAAVGWTVRSITRRRLQRRVAELEYERGLEQERARIAQDIHDEIGASMTRITMLSQTGETDDPARPTPPALHRIHETALEITRTLDEIVWALNPRHDTLASLALYLARFAQERLGEAGVSCRLDMPLNLPHWPLKTQVRHHLLLAFKEAISNTLRHSGATEVRIGLELGDHDFRVLVEDNGSGFVVENAITSRRVGGNGLRHLRSRLAAIGGACEIDSQPGAGTRIVFLIRVPQRGTPAPAPSASPPPRVLPSHDS